MTAEWAEIERYTAATDLETQQEYTELVHSWSHIQAYIYIAEEDSHLITNIKSVLIPADFHSY